MPMVSKSQRRKLWATNPTLAREFEDKTPKGARLPERVRKAKPLGMMEHSEKPGTLGRRARLALAMRHMNRNR
jgi:hypothetical protein